MKNIKKEYNELHKKSFEERLLNQETKNGVYNKRISTTWHQMVFDMLSFYDFKNKMILDAGCGYGALSLEMAKTGAKVTGIDISSNAVEISKSYAADFNLNANFVEGNLENLSFKSNLFDIVCSCETIEHVPNYRTAVDELIRVTKSGGYIIVTIPNILNPIGLYGDTRIGSKQPFENSFNYFSIINLFNRKDIDILRVESRDLFMYLKKISKFLDRVSNILTHYPPMKYFGLRIGLLIQKK